MNGQVTEVDNLDLLNQAVEIAENLDLDGLLELQDRVDYLINDWVAQDLGSNETSQGDNVLPKRSKG